MYGDITRRTFDAADGYRAVLLQQGRVLLDADVNEQAEIVAHHDEARTRDIVGRHGGPAPGGPGEPGPFAIVGDKVAWADLRLTPGSYYVDGVLCELPASAVSDGSWSLTSQPMMPRIRNEDDDSEPLRMLEEPAAGSVVAFLDVWTRQVTADEDPSLLEPALGGADTTTRARTTWQLRTQPQGTDTAETVQDPRWRHRDPRLMTAEVDEPPQTTGGAIAGGDTGSGYRNLENQLYRVQVHATDGDTATILWSRDNGSTVARILEIQTGPALALDRNGRDEISSIRSGDLVEVTSADLEWRGEKGFLATVQDVSSGDPQAARVIVRIVWDDDNKDDNAPTLKTLGLVPVVRRWDGRADIPAPGTPVPLGDDGISVTFPAPAATETRTFEVGDHWLIPARTARLAFGLGEEAGSIDWPVDGPPDDRKPRAMPPAGPDHRYAPLAILTRDAKGWARDTDCRRLFDPLTDPAPPPPTLHLLGGDGQTAPPGIPLAQPIRVAVRGGRLKDLKVGVSAPGGHLAAGAVPDLNDPGTLGPDPVGGSRVVEFAWLLKPDGPRSQSLTVSLDGAPAAERLVLSGGLDVYDQVPWQPPGDCTGFDQTTLQTAVVRLVRATRLVLMEGNGQHVRSATEFAPRPIRVLLTSECGPVQGVEIIAVPSGDGSAATLDPAVPGPPAPGPGPGIEAVALTDADGRAAFWWRPGSAPNPSVVVRTDDGRPPLVVETSSRAGTRITGFTFGSGAAFAFDSAISPADLASGVEVTLDGDSDVASVQGMPVLHAVLDLPWPFLGDGGGFAAEPIGWRPVELAGTCATGNHTLTWHPSDACRDWLTNLWPHLTGNSWNDTLHGRFVVDAWSIPGLLLPEDAAGGTVVRRFTTSPPPPPNP